MADPAAAEKTRLFLGDPHAAHQYLACARDIVRTHGPGSIESVLAIVDAMLPHVAPANLAQATKLAGLLRRACTTRDIHLDEARWDGPSMSAIYKLPAGPVDFTSEAHFGAHWNALVGEIAGVIAGHA